VPSMLTAFHPLRSDPDTIHMQFANDQFIIHNRWAMMVGFIFFNIIGIIWLTMVLSIVVAETSGIWSDDSTLWQKRGHALLALSMGIYSFGLVALLARAMRIWRNPYRLMLDENINVIACSLTGLRRIKLESIRTIEVQLDENCDETVKPGLCIQHSQGEMRLDLFSGHESFVNRLVAARPAIDVFINGLRRLTNASADRVDGIGEGTIASQSVEAPEEG
jgi:hypothetical protein